MLNTLKKTVTATVVVLLATSCASAPAPEKREGEGVRFTTGSDSQRELSALLLLLADRRLHEPYTASRALEGGPARRAELARALGRSLDPRGRFTLEELALDPDEQVAAEAAFGLGLLGDERSVPALVRCVASCAEAPAIEAVRALARLGVGLEVVVDALDDLSEVDRRRRLVPALAQFRGPLVTAAASVAVGETDLELRRAAAAALAVANDPEAAPLARRLIDDEDDEIRRFAVLGLAAGASRHDLEVLFARLDDPNPRVVIAALEVGALVVRDGRAGADSSWRDRVTTFVGDPRTPVRLAAIEAADVFLRDQGLAAALLARAKAGSPWERRLAVRALALGGEGRATELLAVDRVSSDPISRASAAEVAAILSLSGVIEALRDDPHPRVRTAAWRATVRALARQPASTVTERIERDEVLRLALSDADLGVREAVLELLVGSPIAPLEILAPVLEAARGSRALPLRLAAVRAIAARATVERLEQGGAILALEKAFEDTDHPTRREVVVALATLERPPPAALGGREVSWGSERYREILELAVVAGSGLRIVTTGGEAVVELECATVPLSCHFVRQLAGQGFYDNTLVVASEPGAAVVLGDPRGDGRGGAGFRVADEPTRVPVERGAVGLVAAAGPDTAAGPLFITFSPHPELQGTRALIGRVVQGLDVLEALVPGDQIVRIEPIGTL